REGRLGQVLPGAGIVVVIGQDGRGEKQPRLERLRRGSSAPGVQAVKAILPNPPRCRTIASHGVVSPVRRHDLDGNRAAPRLPGGPGEPPGPSGSLSAHEKTPVHARDRTAGPPYAWVSWNWFQTTQAVEHDIAPMPNE